MDGGFQMKIEINEYAPVKGIKIYSHRTLSISTMQLVIGVNSIFKSARIMEIIARLEVFWKKIKGKTDRFGQKQILKC